MTDKARGDCGGGRMEVLEIRKSGKRQSLTPMRKRAKDEVLLGALNADDRTVSIRYPYPQRDTKFINSKQIAVFKNKKELWHPS